MPMDPDHYLDATAAALELAIAPEHRPGVLRYLQLAAAMAERIESLPLDPADEPGSTFRPVEPRS